MCANFVIAGGSGNAISCSLLYQHHEAFQDEVIVAALNVAVGKTAPVDYVGRRHVKNWNSIMTNREKKNWLFVKFRLEILLNINKSDSLATNCHDGKEYK